MNYEKERSVDRDLFATLISAGVSNLNKNVRTVNDLNVFPIPDGDTGDNMLHTISGGLEKLRAAGVSSLGESARSLADGMLMNARGNSGVILSQLFAGMAAGLNGLLKADLYEFASAFNEGVKTAYRSVVKPVEGTILTVARESFEYAAQRLNEKSDLAEYFSDVLSAMRLSLENTPNLLDVLKEAGVVDSGGAGLYFIVDGMKNALTGAEAEGSSREAPSSQKTLDFSLFGEDTPMEFGYCTELLLRLRTAKTDVSAFDEKIIIDYLSTIGDSIVCFKTGSIVKVHVHTFEPSKVLEFCQKFGEFLTIKIENMTLQHNETVKDEIAFTKTERARRPFGVVTVASGAGVISLFKEFGADVVIDGGQGKNPSTEEFIKAFDEVNADEIFVLPNNSNIIMTAKQAADMYKGAKIRVIETRNVGECYSALSMLDYSSGDAEKIAENLISDSASVTCGMVTRAVRAAHLNGVEIREGDYIGFTDKTMYSASSDPVGALKVLLEKLGVKEKNFLIVLCGASAKAEDRVAVKAYAESIRGLEFYEIEGGQDVYDYIAILE